jgi:hypothetical protein
MVADTSSPAAAAIPVVGSAAAVCAALIVEPRLSKLVAASDITAGTAKTNDIEPSTRNTGIKWSRPDARHADNSDPMSRNCLFSKRIQG